MNETVSLPTNSITDSVEQCKLKLAGTSRVICKA